VSDDEDEDSTAGDRCDDGECDDDAGELRTSNSQDVLLPLSFCCGAAESDTAEAGFDVANIDIGGRAPPSPSWVVAS